MMLKDSTPEKERDFCSYCAYLWQYIHGMFKWKCEKIPEWAFEALLNRRGHVGLFHKGDDLIMASGGYTGELDRYGVGKRYIGTTFNGEEYIGEVGKDVIVLWNNMTLSPDTHIVSAYARRFVESDRSILNVLRGARITALVTASDNTDNQTLNNVVEAIKKGDTVVKIPPIFREIDALDSGVKRFDIMRLTDPKDTDKLQYLTRYRDDLLAAFLNEYGIDVNVINKGSQVSKDELHSMGAAVNAVLDSRLDCRKRDLDIVRSWGFEIEVNPGYSRGDEQTEPEQEEAPTQSADPEERSMEDE